MTHHPAENTSFFLQTLHVPLGGCGRLWRFPGLKRSRMGRPQVWAVPGTWLPMATAWKVFGGSSHGVRQAGAPSPGDVASRGQQKGRENRRNGWFEVSRVLKVGQQRRAGKTQKHKVRRTWSFLDFTAQLSRLITVAAISHLSEVNKHYKQPEETSASYPNVNAGDSVVFLPEVGPVWVCLQVDVSGWWWEWSPPRVGWQGVAARLLIGGKGWSNLGSSSEGGCVAETATQDGSCDNIVCLFTVSRERTSEKNNCSKHEIKLIHSFVNKIPLQVRWRGVRLWLDSVFVFCFFEIKIQGWVWIKIKKKKMQVPLKVVLSASASSPREEGIQINIPINWQ